jgi:hypothetical protein
MKMDRCSTQSTRQSRERAPCPGNDTTQAEHTTTTFRHVASLLPHPDLAKASLDICLAILCSNMIADSIRHNSGLDTLQSGKQRHLLDTIDRLRNCGLDSELSLPQLVVCGDQSSGTHYVTHKL